MPIVNSPLRYPGGKAILSDFIAETLRVNSLRDGVYVEPYAGGAGAALNLLFSENVQQIILNDADPCVYAFWDAILNRKRDFIRRLNETPICIEEWRNQRNIYRQQWRHSRIKVAFASFYLNRCNRSGIMVNGGPIGGFDQKGKWKLDARYNREELIRRIEKIHMYRDRIAVFNLDAIEVLKKLSSESGRKKMFIYLDPPYYSKGNQLYLNYYGHQDHSQLAIYLQQQLALPWLLTYDNVAEINDLYFSCQRIPISLSYSAHRRRTGSELIIHSDQIALPAVTPYVISCSE